MDLLKYLEPMKHLPDRFSNLAFWRGCRKFKDAVVNALEYVDSWGESVESQLDNIKTTDYKRNQQLNLTVEQTSIPTSRYMIIDSKFLYISNLYGLIIGTKLPSNYGAPIYVSVTVTQEGSTSTDCLGFFTPMLDSGRIKIVANHLTGLIPSGTFDTSLPLTINYAYIIYNPTK